MKLSVVVPYYRASDTIDRQLRALSAQTWSDPWEVVLSDNERSDDLREIVRRHEGSIRTLRIIDASERRGEAHARNAGVEASKGEFIAFCDADDEVGPGWLKSMGKALLAHEFVACRLEIEKLNPPWVASVFSQHPQQWGLQRAWFPPYLSHAGGGTLGFSKSVFDSVNGFDESWPVLTDTDYCFRVQLAGTPLHFVPDAVIHLRCRNTLPRLFAQSRTWAEHVVRLYKQYRPPGTRIPRPWQQYVSRWHQLLRDRSQVKSDDSRGTWVWRFGWQIGLLQGSVKHFIPPV